MLLSKPLIPSNGTSVILEGNKKEYIYYKFGKDGLVFNNSKSEFSLDDSVRIKLFIRTITNELNKEELLKVKVEIAVGKGKKLYDKRQVKKQRDWNREKERYFRKSS